MSRCAGGPGLKRGISLCSLTLLLPCVQQENGSTGSAQLATRGDPLGGHRVHEYSAHPRCGMHITTAPALMFTSWQLCLPTESAERGDLRSLVPVVLVAGITTWALVSPPSAHMPVLHLDRRKTPVPSLFTLSVHVPPPVSCTAIALTKQSFGYYPKPFLQNSSEFTHGGQSDGTFGCLEKVGGARSAGGGGGEIQRRCWM